MARIASALSAVAVLLGLMTWDSTATIPVEAGNHANELNQPEPPAALIDTTTGIHRGVVFLHCAQEFGWTGVSATCANYTANTPLAAIQDKIDTGFSVYNAPILNFINPVLAAKVGVALQITRSPGYPFDYTKFNAAQWRQGNFAQPLNWWLQNHPDWIAYRCDGGIAWEYGDVPFNNSTAPAWVPLDVANQAVRDFYWNEYVKPAIDHGAPLVFFDNLAVFNAWQRCGHYNSSNQWVQQYSADYQDPVYQAAMFSWVEWLYATIKTYRPSVIVAMNYDPAESNDPTPISNRVLDNLDMLFDEAGFNYWGNFKALDSLWQRKKDLILNAQAKGKAIFHSETTFVTDPVTQASHDDRNWGLANYLLFNGGRQYIGWSGITCTNCGSFNFNDYGYYADMPEYTNTLGSPTSGMYQSQGVWMRNFQNGLVIVNPDGTNGYNLSLPAGLTDLSGAPIGPSYWIPNQVALVLIGGSASQAPAITSAGSAAFTVGTPGSFTVTKTGIPSPTLSQATTDTLPAGVTFTPATGVLAGTPAAGSQGTYALHFTAANGVPPDATQTFTLTVNPAAPIAPTITSANATSFAIGSAGSFTVVAIGTPAPTLSMAGTDTLPAGVTFTPATGVLAGTPAAGSQGTYALHFTAANGVPPDATQTFTLTVTPPNQAPAFTSANSTGFTAGTPGTFTVTATGSPVPVLSQANGDSMPAGVSFNAATGVISGTPAPGQGGTYVLHFTASNGVAPNATQTFTLAVNQAPAFSSAASATFIAQTANTFTVMASGTPAAILSQSGADTMPSGVTFNAATGVLSGTPAAAAVGTYTLHFTATNGIAPAATQTFTLKVDPKPAGTGVIGVSPSSGSFTPGTYFYVTMNLSAAVPFNAAGATVAASPNLEIQGVNAVPGVVNCGIVTYPVIARPANPSFSATFSPASMNCAIYQLTVRVVGTGTGTITVNGGFMKAASDGAEILGSTMSGSYNLGGPTGQAPVFTSGANTTFTVGAAGNFGVTAIGSPAPALSMAPTDVLPGGVTFVPATGALTGMPAAGSQGTYTLHFTAANGVAPNATQTFTLLVTPSANQAPAFTSANATSFTVGSPGTFTVRATGIPPAVLSQSGGNVMPAGVTFVPATGVLSGTPAAGSQGTYTLNFTASNGVAPNATQTFILTVNPAPTGSGSIRVSPSSGTHALGSYFYVTMNLSAAVPFNAAGATVSASPNLEIQGVNVAPGVLNCAVATYPVIARPANPSFFATFNPASTNCAIYQLTVKVIGPGTGTITVSGGTMKAASNGAEIFSSATSGTYTLN